MYSHAHSQPSSRRPKTKEEQEAEDMRLAMQLQEEEERRSAGSSRAASNFSRSPPAAPQAAPQRRSGSAAAESDYELALRLAGDTPQEFGSGSHRQTSRGSRQPSRSPPVVAPPAEPERKLTKEEQEAEDMRLAMELQSLEERAVLRNAPTPPAPQQQQQQGTHMALQMARQPDVLPYSSAAATASSSSAAAPSAKGHDLFNAIRTPQQHQQQQQQGQPAAAAAPTAPQQSIATTSNTSSTAAKPRDFMDDLFSSPSSASAASPQSNTAAATAAARTAGSGAGIFGSAPPAGGAQQQQALPRSDTLDIFADAPSGTNAARPPAAGGASATWSAAPAAGNRSLVDDLFASPAPVLARPQQQPSSNGTPASGGDMQAHLDMFAAGHGNRAW